MSILVILVLFRFAQNYPLVKVTCVSMVPGLTGTRACFSVQRMRRVRDPAVRDKRAQILFDRASRCAEETERYYQGRNFHTRDCFELFELAILRRDPDAWEAIYQQYQALVSRWVQGHPAFEACGEEVSYFVNRAFEKIWIALTPEKFRHFTELRALLSYLKMCVHSVITDHTRSIKLAELVALAEEGSSPGSVPSNSLEEQALERTDRSRIWASVSARLHNEKERRVVFGSFFLALKPSELFEQYPGSFQNVEEVYLVKQNVLARLRRDVDLVKLLRVDD